MRVFDGFDQIMMESNFDIHPQKLFVELKIKFRLHQDWCPLAQILIQIFRISSTKLFPMARTFPKKIGSEAIVFVKTTTKLEPSSVWKIGLPLLGEFS